MRRLRQGELVGWRSVEKDAQKRGERAGVLQKGLFKIEYVWVKLCKRQDKEPQESSRTNNFQNSL